MTLLLISCGTTDLQRIDAAARVDAEASLTDQALAVGANLPDLPSDCRKRERSGVVIGDRQDVALAKSDRALGRANARVGRCATWYDDIQNQPKGPVT